MPGKDRHRKREVARVHANGRSSHKAVGRRDGLAAADLVGGSSAEATMATPNSHAPAREAPSALSGGLLIYLKHRGVLNVEEFRRTDRGHR